jgi:AraC-like DNA-binding protein
MLQLMLSFKEFAADLPLAHTQWFTSPTALEKALAELGIVQPTRQATRGEFRAGLAARKMQDSELYSDRYSTAISVHLQTPPGQLAILLPRSPHDHFIVNGVNLENSHLALTPSCGSMDIAGPGPSGSDCIAMSRMRFQELLETLCPTAGLKEGLSLVKVFAPELRSLGDLVVNLVAAPDSKSECERSGNLLAWTVSLIGHASEQFRPEGVNGSAVQHQIARNTQDFIEANFQECVQLESICRHTGVGVRTVQRCFREYFDLSVTDYLKTIRLDKAHRVLETTEGGEESVTDIALRCGFTHLGRFSVAYRTRFGESPSETLITPTGAGDF